MAIKIKNIDTEPHNWGGKLFEAGELYPTEDSADAKRYGFDEVFLSDFMGGKAEVYDESENITAYSKAVYLLQSGKILAPTDQEDKPFVRVSMTKSNWHYGPRSLDFVTSKVGSLFNREHFGPSIDLSTDIGDAVTRYYEIGEYGEEIEMVRGEGESEEDFQVRLGQYCTKSVCEFEHPIGIDIWGAKWMFDREPQGRAYLWVVAAPDVPKAWGGNIAFMGGGMALHMMQPKHAVIFDAKTTKLMTYDPVYHSGKIAIIVKHSPGEQIGVQLILDFYEE